MSDESDRSQKRGGAEVKNRISTQKNDREERRGARKVQGNKGGVGQKGRE